VQEAIVSGYIVGLIIAVFIGLIQAYVAKSKGHSFAAWWLFGAAFFIVAFPCSLFLKQNTETLEREKLDSGGYRKCSFCAELVKSEATVCRFCGRGLGSGGSDTPIDSDDVVTRRLVEILQRNPTGNNEPTKGA
jgi:hypothetical protein